jgi:hypothetical protein
MKHVMDKVLNDEDEDGTNAFLEKAKSMPMATRNTNKRKSKK